MRYITLYLLYAAVLIRGVTSYSQTAHLLPAIALIVLFGVLLVLDQFVFEQRIPLGSRVRKVYPVGYLVVQTCVVDVLLLLPPRPDFYAILFIPLSMQAALWFGRRTGYAAIGVLIACMAIALFMGSGGAVSELALVLLYGTACVLVGIYANLVKYADLARHENLRLYDELKRANRQLLDYSAQVEELTVANERNRLARELHDSVTQTVFSMTLALQAARVLWDKDRGRVRPQLDRLQELARSAVGEIQVLISELRPVSLVDKGVAAAIRRECDERKERDGLQVRCRVISEKPLPEPLAEGLFRIVHEALNNVVKHAGTQQATVTLDLASGQPYVDVSDEGVGFTVDAAAQQTGHMGLIGMAERAREMGWVLMVESQPGHGTRVHVEPRQETVAAVDAATIQTSVHPNDDQRQAAR
jgi:signal transduction histidine kinase